jgi:thiol-disulfide isomerase/thioredoxin
MSQFSLHKANPTSVTLSRRRFMGLGFWASSLALVGPTSSPQFGQQAMAQGRTDFLGFGDAERSSNARDALLGAKQWLNTAALSTEDLAGKVLLVNFWTYSCINSLRALPYTGEWAGKYGASGLRVIGVHTPEFAFEKDVGNIRKALARYQVDYPIAVDSDYRIWQSFANEAWPAFFFIDANGNVRHRKYGEGEYDESEQLIQKLLTEAGAAAPGGLVADHGAGVLAAPDWDDVQSPETYLGYAKATNFISASRTKRDRPTHYESAQRLSLNQWSLAGAWTVGPEFVSVDGAQGAITLRFHARDLHLVMGPSPSGQPVRFRVTLDGAALKGDHGTDIDVDGQGTVQDVRLYQLIRQSGTVKDRTMQIEFSSPGARAYVFTFG